MTSAGAPRRAGRQDPLPPRRRHGPRAVRLQRLDEQVPAHASQIVQLRAERARERDELRQARAVVEREPAGSATLRGNASRPSSDAITAQPWPCSCTPDGAFDLGVRRDLQPPQDRDHGGRFRWCRGASPARHALHRSRERQRVSGRSASACPARLKPRSPARYRRYGWRPVVAVCVGCEDPPAAC